MCIFNERAVHQDIKWDRSSSEKFQSNERLSFQDIRHFGNAVGNRHAAKVLCAVCF